MKAASDIDTISVDIEKASQSDRLFCCRFALRNLFLQVQLFFESGLL